MRFSTVQVCQITGFSRAQLSNLIKHEIATYQPRSARQQYKFSYTDTLKLLAMSVLTHHFSNPLVKLSEYKDEIDRAIGSGDQTMRGLIQFKDRDGKALVLDISKLRDRLDGRIQRLSV